MTDATAQLHVVSALALSRERRDTDLADSANPMHVVSASALSRERRDADFAGKR
jgi:hypothetical protein